MHISRSVRMAVVSLIVLASLIIAGTALAAEDSPMLPVDALSGERAGKQFCFCCDDGDKTYAVVFVKTYNDMVMGFAKQADDLLADHKDAGVLIVPLGDRDGIEAKLKADIKEADLKRVTIGFPAGERGAEQLRKWDLDKAKQTNVFVVADHKITGSFTAGCPHCDGVAGKIGKSF